MSILLFLVFLVFTLVILAQGLPVVIWELAAAGYFFVALFISHSLFLTLISGLILSCIILLIHIQPLRYRIAEFVYGQAKASIPKLSKTEEEALNAGDTWFEKDIFRGEPDWDKLATVSSALTEEEEAFLTHETEELCAMLDNWEISQDKDLSPKVWAFLKEKGFFGLVISKEYGGKGFSARAHSDIVIKIASRSGAAAVTVMVPNSLGPGELLQHYGTEGQKKRWLPDLATGKEIPCFALTEPGAGSDATSIQSEAIVEQRILEGETVIGLHIPHLNKRWITLSPVATLIGLAVLLKDPDNLLKEGGLPGITCLLISRDTENLEIGNRHFPSEQYFMNGTIHGNNLFVPLSSIIGGEKNAGKGWQMLVECLAIGRSISLPALSAASSAVAYLTTGAWARIRRQFNVEIGQFEGIEEKLAEIAGLTYIIQATRLLTVAAVNAKIKPSVASGITKYFNTEFGRIVINHAMDVHAGRAVVSGPRNYLMMHYQALPISITVEGANIMTRNLLIFGQGSMACHPYIKEEFYAIAADDKVKFSELLWKHVHYFLSRLAKTLCAVWTGGLFISAPESALRRDYQRLARLSYAFSWLADFALIYLGGRLKRKERLSARLADSLSSLYLAMAVLRYYQAHDKQADQKVHAAWALRYCLNKAQNAMIGFCNNFPSKPLGVLLRFVTFPFGATISPPDDKLEHQLAKSMMMNNTFRTYIKKSIYLSGDKSEPIDRMEQTLQLLIENSDLAERVPGIKRCNPKTLRNKLEEKVALQEISEVEKDILLQLEQAKWDAIQVDEFDLASTRNKNFKALNRDVENIFS